jgi:hypothetical protein
MKNNWIKDYITEAFKETKEATATGGGYGYSTKAFSMWSEDEEAKSEYKRSKKEKVEGEFKEATDSSSIGAYDYNSFQDVNMKGNTVKGKGRSWKQSQIPGGEFVEINPKCKTFPYCNQGNTGAVRYRKTKKSSPVNEAIENVSKKTGLSVQEIKNIILSSIDSN